MLDTFWEVKTLRLIAWALRTNPPSWSTLWIDAHSPAVGITPVVGQISKAVAQFGLPDRARSDHGGENMNVRWRYYVLLSYLCSFTRSSSCNEYIKRLWHVVLARFFTIFCAVLRMPVFLNHSMSISSVHTVFLPQINQCLQSFMESWNFLHLSTQHILRLNSWTCWEWMIGWTFNRLPHLAMEVGGKQFRLVYRLRVQR